MEEAGSRTVKLFCPSLSKVSQVVARDDQRLDLGSIARTFGLDPATIKLNGHFISRGVDLIASSVTWKSLLSFFSSRGLSTGLNGSPALVIDGKLSKLGSKRGHDSADVDDGNPSSSNQGYNNVNGKYQHKDVNISCNKRPRDTGPDTGSEKDVKCNNVSLKRKPFMEASNSLKKIRVNEDFLGSQKREDGRLGTISKMVLPCSLIGVNTKRGREDDTITPAACKKIRGN